MWFLLAVLQGSIMGGLRMWYRKTSFGSQVRMTYIYSEYRDHAVIMNIVCGALAGALISICFFPLVLVVLFKPSYFGVIDKFHHRLAHNIKVAIYAWAEAKEKEMKAKKT
jgi:hypothetical protein